MGKCCNFDELLTLQSKVSKLQTDGKTEFIEACVKDLAALLLELVTPATPVGVYPSETGKNGGTLRHGWTSKTESEAISGTGSDSTPPRTYVHSLEVKKKGKWYTIEVVNPVEYASYVEYGHRQTPGRFVPAIGKCLVQAWVEGRLMLTKSEEQLKRTSPAMIEKELRKMIEEAFSV